MPSAMDHPLSLRKPAQTNQFGTLSLVSLVYCACQEFSGILFRSRLLLGRQGKGKSSKINVPVIERITASRKNTPTRSVSEGYRKTSLTLRVGVKRFDGTARKRKSPAARTSPASPNHRE